MPKRAERAELIIDRENGDKLMIDGEEFPWDIFSDGLQLLYDGENATPMILMAVPVNKLETRYATPSILFEDDEEPRLKAGDELEAVRDLPPPEYVWALEERNSESIRFLIRIGKESEGGRWMWMDHIPEEPLSPEVYLGFSWFHLGSEYWGDLFDVRRVHPE